MKRRWHSAGLWSAALTALLLPVAARAQYTLEQAVPNQISAGAMGVNITMMGPVPTFPSATDAVCFLTGYGGSATEINPSSATVLIPDAYIDEIPPDQFTSGTFTAQMYIAAAGQTCDGVTTESNIQGITINEPAIYGVTPTGVQQTNSATGVTAPPSLLDLTGTGFVSNSTASYTWSGGSASAGVVLLPDGALAVKVPAIPAGVATVTATLCNVTPDYQYCAEPFSLNVNALVASTGSLQASSNPATANEPVTLTAQFAATGPATNNPGTPTGIVSFTSNGSALGTGRLVLDPTAGLLSQIGSQQIEGVPNGKMQVVDVNGDGLADVVFFDTVGDIVVFPGGTPFGVLQEPMVSTPDFSCEATGSYAIGDVNGDGIPDVVYDCNTGVGPDTIDLALGNGDGTFATAIAVPGTFGNQVALADLNQSGPLDLVVSGSLNGCTPGCAASFGFQIFKGDGKGDFTLANTVQTTTGGPSTEMLLAKIDGDKYPDIVVLNLSSAMPSMDVYLNDGTGTNFGTSSPPYSVPNGSVQLGNPMDVYQNMVAADFNGDGLNDLAVAESGSANQIIYAYNATALGANLFGDPRAFGIANPEIAMSAADFNGDGAAELAVTDATGITVYNANGKGQFGKGYSGLAIAPSGSQVAAGVAGDLNADGDADVVLVTIPAGPAPSYFLTSYLTTGPANASVTASLARSTGDAIAATWPGNVNFSGSTANLNLPVNGLTSTTVLSLPNTPSEYGQTVSLMATVSSTAGSPTGSVTFMDGSTPVGSAPLVSGVASLPIATLSAGTHVITAVYSGDSSFAGSNSVTGNQVVNRAVVSIAWTPLPATITYGTGLVAGQLNATASTKYVASVTGSFLYNPTLGTVLGAGTQPLGVSFTPSDANDFVATTGSASITVTKANPTVSWSAPAGITYGTALSGTQLNATATGISGALAGSFVYTPAAGTVLGAGNGQALSVKFTPTDTTDYNVVTVGTTINVAKATPTVSWSAPAGITYGTALSGTQLNATATGISGALAGGFVYTPAAGTVLGAGNNQALSVTFTPTDTADYNNATGGTTISVAKATPTVSWSAPAGIMYGTALSGTQLNATATGIAGALAGGFVYTPAAGTVLGAGNNQALSVTFTPTDTTDYNNATGGTTINVAKATPTVNWSAPAGISYGTALSGTQLNASATGISGALAGSFVYTPVAGTVLNAGNNQALSVTFTPTDSTDYNTAIGGTTINVGKVTPTVSWSSPGTIVVGTPLSSTQLNATATGISGALAGAFAYTPAAGTVLTVGNNQALNVLFTPTDLTDYNTAPGSTTINVIGLSVTTLTPTTATLGDVAKTLTVTGVGFLTNSVVQVNGTALATTFVNATTLTATLPATYFQTVQTLNITVADPTQGQTSNIVTIAVGAPAPVVTFSGPGTVQPAQQPTLTFALSAYPVALTGTMTLTFAGTGGADDPSIQFASGGRTYSFTVAANSTTVPAIQLQSGTDAGTITVTLTLSAGGQNVTPGSVQPLVIVVPPVAPAITSFTLTRSGSTVTANVIGYSNTRQATQAEFKFTGANGQAIDNPDVVVDATTLFSTWFTNAASQAYGSAFLYTQTFNLNTDASNIGSITVTLTNSSGTSTTATAQ